MTVSLWSAPFLGVGAGLIAGKPAPTGSADMHDQSANRASGKAFPEKTWFKVGAGLPAMRPVIALR
jgi:hypothetical protein